MSGRAVLIYARTYGPDTSPDVEVCGCGAVTPWLTVHRPWSPACWSSGLPVSLPPASAWLGRWVERKGATLPYRPKGPVRLDPETLREVVEEGLDFRRDVEARARVWRG